MKLILYLLRLFPTRLWSKIFGWAASKKWPKFLLRPFLKWYAKHYKVNLEEAEKELSEYNTFLEFFIRKLKPGLRPIDPEAPLISPVDGTISSFGPIEGDTLIPAKGHHYTVSELLGQKSLDRADLQSLADKFRGGSYLVIYLSPRDYHRIHAPINGLIHSFVYSPGRLLPVNPPSVALFKKLFAENERVTTIIEEKSGAYAALIKVGALHVGRIRLLYSPFATNRFGGTKFKVFEPPIPMSKGEELAYFELGSTVILLLSPEFKLENLEINSYIKMGQKLGTLMK